MSEPYGYKYKVVSTQPDYLEDELNKLDREGWEILTVVGLKSQYSTAFKIIARKERDLV